MKKVIKENAKSRLWAVLSSCLIIACISAGLSGCFDPIQSPLLDEIKEEVQEANTPKTYTVTYFPNGATGGKVPVAPVAYKNGQSVIVLGNVNSSILTKTGESLIGWAEHEDGSGERYNPGAYFLMGSANVSLYARWTALPTYTVTFDSKGGSAVAAQVVEEDGTADLPSPSLTWAGYAFGGWYQDEEYLYEWVFSTPITADRTLYAKWTAENYTVTFDAEGGTPSVASVQATFGFDNGVTATGSNANQSVLLVKYNASGTAQWARTVVSGAGASLFNSVAVDGSGYVYAAGEINGTAQVYTFRSGVTATSINYKNAVLVRYSNDGLALWASTTSAATNDSAFFSVAMAETGYLYVAGQINGTGNYNFGSGIINGTSIYANALLVKYETHTGSASWARTVTAGNETSIFKSVAVDASYNVLAAGYIKGTTVHNFAAGVSATGSFTEDNAVLVKYSSSGTATWAKTVTEATASSQFNSVAVDTSSNVYAAGILYGNSSYAFGDAVTATGAYGGSGYNPVLVKYEE